MLGNDIDTRIHTALVNVKNNNLKSVIFKIKSLLLKVFTKDIFQMLGNLSVLDHKVATLNS